MVSALLLLVAANSPSAYWSAPAFLDPAAVRPGGTTVLPNGRWLRPNGKRLYAGVNLWRVVLSPDRTTLLALHDGGVTRYKGWNGPNPSRQVAQRKEVAPAASFLPDGKTVVLSLGDHGKIELMDVDTLEPKAEIDLNASKKDSYLNDFVVDAEGRYLYGVDVANQEVVTVDLAQKQVLNRVAAGRQPYAVALDPATNRLLVANIGVFDYSVIGSPREGEGFPKGLTIPPFGFPSKEAETGREFEGRFVPGLGKAGVPESQSLWSYQIGSDFKPKFEKAVTCGLLIQGQSEAGVTVGASQPNAILIHKNRVFVSNANNDTVQEFDAENLKLRRTIRLIPQPLLKNNRGVTPSALALSPDQTRLYVCASGINAVACIEIASGRIIGYLPSGWWPSWIIADNKQLIISTQKGLGRGPRGPKTPRLKDDERFGFSEMPGMIQITDAPLGPQWTANTKNVLENNGLIPKTPPITSKAFPILPGKKSPNIEYVVFITKENHTFDGIFGGLKGANGEPDYAEFGMKGWITEKGKERRLPIMPNHIALAEQFAISDNFYMEPHASGDGHRWLVGNYPSFWTNRVFYSGWEFRKTDQSKGRLVSFGSDGSQIPEDYLENGSIWHHLERGKVPFRNYGEGFEFPESDEGEDTTDSGVFEPANWPMPKVLYDNTCFEFPVYNNNIPDIARAQWFIRDIENNYRKKGKPLPKFINIAICNDHGAGPKPQFGYPYVCSYMADNDLALGRIVEYLTRQPEWKKMAIFVTQDDPGGDNDHVDRHRSFVLAISPFVKRGYVTHHHTSIMSIIRSIYLLFGLSPNNMFDAVATPLFDMFTDTPDYRPYTAKPSTLEIFDPQKTVDPNDPRFEKRKRLPKAKMDDPAFLDWMNRRANGMPKQ